MSTEVEIELSRTTINRALPKVSDGVRKYTWLQAELHRRDVSCDREYQRCFNGFYRVRRNPAWQDVFYRILEAGKSGRSSLSDILLELHAATGRIEASFSSKLAATIDPRQPVIDSIVLKNIGVRLSSTGDIASRIERIVALSDRMAAAFSEYLQTAEGGYLVAQFSAAYRKARVTQVKMLDLVLWQTRSAA